MKTDMYTPFTKEWFKQFNKLSDKDKQKVLEIVIKNMMNSALVSASSNGVMNGMYLKGERFYTDYVEKMDKMDSHSQEWSDMVEKLLSDIRVCHVEYQKRQEQQNGKEGQAIRT